MQRSCAGEAGLTVHALQGRQVFEVQCRSMQQVQDCDGDMHQAASSVTHAC